MELLKIILLILLQFATGFGILSSFKLELRPWMSVALSILAGIGTIAFALLCLVFLRVSLDTTSFTVVLIITLLLSNIYSFRVKLSNYRKLFSGALWRSIRLYEVPAILVLALVFFVSAWRCFYLPSYARDLTSGPEVIAEYAVKEHKIDNSVFTVNLESTNNQFKSPFIIVLQMLYKFAGFDFGQVWLSGVVLSFMIFLYQALARKIHVVFAGALLLWFMAIPEMYAYTFMLLYDYSNAVFFTVGLYLLLEYINGEENAGYIALAALFWAFATYIRSETLVLVGLFALAYGLMQLFRKEKFVPLLRKGLILVVPSLLIYYITGSFYLNHYIPQQYDVSELVNKDLGNLNPLFTRFFDIIDKLLLSPVGTMHYGNFLKLFLVFVCIDFGIYLYNRKKLAITSTYRQAIVYIAAALVCIFAIAFIGYLLPLADLNNTTKRALFKFFPILLLYFGYSLSLRKITEKLTY